MFEQRPFQCPSMGTKSERGLRCNFTYPKLNDVIFAEECNVTSPSCFIISDGVTHQRRCTEENENTLKDLEQAAYLHSKWPHL